MPHNRYYESLIISSNRLINNILAKLMPSHVPGALKPKSNRTMPGNARPFFNRGQLRCYDKRRTVLSDKRLLARML